MGRYTGTYRSGIFDEETATPRVRFHMKWRVVLARITGQAFPSSVWFIFETDKGTLGFVEGQLVLDSGISIQGDDYALMDEDNARNWGAPAGWRRINTLNEPCPWDEFVDRNRAIYPERFENFLEPTVISGAKDGFIGQTCGWHKEKPATTRVREGFQYTDNAMSADPLSMGGGRIVRTEETSPAIPSRYPNGVPPWVEVT